MFILKAPTPTTFILENANASSRIKKITFSLGKTINVDGYVYPWPDNIDMFLDNLMDREPRIEEWNQFIAQMITFGKNWPANREKHAQFLEEVIKPKFIEGISDAAFSAYTKAKESKKTTKPDPLTYIEAGFALAESFSAATATLSWSWLGELFCKKAGTYLNLVENGQDTVGSSTLFEAQFKFETYIKHAVEAYSKIPSNDPNYGPAQFEMANIYYNHWQTFVTDSGNAAEKVRILEKALHCAAAARDKELAGVIFSSLISDDVIKGVDADKIVHFKEPITPQNVDIVIDMARLARSGMAHVEAKENKSSERQSSVIGRSITKPRVADRIASLAKSKEHKAQDIPDSQWRITSSPAEEKAGIHVIKNTNLLAKIAKITFLPCASTGGQIRVELRSRDDKADFIPDPLDQNMATRLQDFKTDPLKPNVLIYDWPDHSDSRAIALITNMKNIQSTFIQGGCRDFMEDLFFAKQSSFSESVKQLAGQQDYQGIVDLTNLLKKQGDSGAFINLMNIFVEQGDTKDFFAKMLPIFIKDPSFEQEEISQLRQIESFTKLHSYAQTVMANYYFCHWQEDSQSLGSLDDGDGIQNCAELEKALRHAAKGIDEQLKTQIFSALTFPDCKLSTGINKTNVELVIEMARTVRDKSIGMKAPTVEPDDQPEMAAQQADSLDDEHGSSKSEAPAFRC